MCNSAQIREFSNVYADVHQEIKSSGKRTMPRKTEEAAKIFYIRQRNRPDGFYEEKKYDS